MYLSSFFDKLVPILKKDNNKRYFNYCHRVEKHLLYEIKNTYAQNHKKAKKINLCYDYYITKEY